MESTRGESEQPAAVLSRSATIVAVGLVMALLVFILTLVLLRNDPQWDRLLYLFTGLEAIVFVAAGALFGTRIERQRSADAESARDEAVSRARRLEGESHAGRALAAFIRAGAIKAADEWVPQRGGERSAVGAPLTDYGALLTVVDELFPKAD